VRREPSLRLRLLVGILAAVALAWVGVAWSAYLQSRHELDELFDAHLAQSASLLIAQLSEDDDDDDDEIEFEHAPRLHHYARNVAFQVWERGKRLRVHSRSAPSARLSKDDDGFSDGTVDGVEWRVFSAWTRGRRALVQVGERRDAREEVSREVAAQILLPLGLALPLLGGVLAFAIGRALRPLRNLADDIGGRDPQRLEPVAASDAPREIRPLVERLNALFARIAKSLESERAFTADAAHELRTPLAAIRAQAEVARKAGGDAERRRALDQVIAGCDRAARLSEQLLTLARLDANDTDRCFGPCDLTEVARDVLAELAPAAHERGVAVELESQTPAVVQGDAGLLHILLRNLVDNAARYAPRGTVVRVGTATPAPSAVLHVSDEGSGIPPAERARVLDRFYRVLGTNQPGAGLGLSIVARIAALHGASLELGEGSGGRGLVVRVRFPPGATRAASAAVD
jgi:two-component system sensor histidine kinase QseC